MTAESKAEGLERARAVEKAASHVLAVAEYALVIEAVVVARQVKDGAHPTLGALVAAVDRREDAQAAHVAAMRAYRDAAVGLTRAEPVGDFDA